MSDPDFIPDDQFTPDAAPSQVGAPAPDFIPDGEFQSDADKYGSPIEQAKTIGEGLASGATLGLSKIAETKLLGVKPEDIAGREEANPWESGISQTAGSVAGLLGPEEALAPVKATQLLGRGAEALASKAVPDVAARIAGMAVEGGAYNAATGAATREAMGDPALDAQKIAADAGFGALIGGGLGTLFESGAGLAKAMLRAKAGVPGAADAVEAASGESPSVPQVVSAPVEAKSGVQPTSFEEMQQRVDSAIKNGTSLDMPQKAALLDAASRVQTDFPVHPLQADALTDQESWNAYKTGIEMPGEKFQTLRDYQNAQRNDWNSQTDQTIQNLSPGVEPTSDAVEGGNRASEAFTEQYQNEKKELGPIFQRLKETPLPEGMDAKAGILDSMIRAVPGVSHMFEATGEDLNIKPYKTSWGIDRATYNAAKEAMDALSEGEPDFEELQNIRRGLDQHVDVMAQGPAASQIRAMKAAMMDYMQDAVQRASPDLAVREAFKRYAINEQERNVIEKAFGASVGSPEFGSISKIKPEYIGDKIFANTANVSAAKSILDPEKFNQILANWISEAKASATKDGVFSSNKFGAWLTKNQDALKVAFQENPESLQKLKDLNTMTRILPDSKPINPSGTAKTLANYFKNVTTGLSSEDFWSKGATLIPKLYKELADVVEHHKIMARLDSQLKGTAAADSVQAKIAKTAVKVSNDIADKSKSIFSGSISAGVAAMSIGSYDKNSKRIQELSNHPQEMSDHMTKTTAALYQAAPDVAQGLHNSMAAGVQFLNSKIPRPAQELPLSGKWQPSIPQKQTFNRYYQTVNEPISALKRIKNGTLNSQDMEALQAVHPDLLNEMRMNVMQNIQKDQARKLPSGTKIALSKFLGQPVDESMLPSSIQANQIAHIQPPQPKVTVKGTKNLNMAKRAAGEVDE